MSKIAGHIRLIQLQDADLGPRVGFVQDDGNVFDLTLVAPDVAPSTLTLVERSEGLPLAEVLEPIVADALKNGPSWKLDFLNGESEAAHLISPIEAPEVWAAGVTYKRSRDARVEESVVEADFYSRVYAAERPELFMKTSGMRRVANPYGPICIRSDSRWTVPEPELAVIVGTRAEIAGYTIGNDVSARDVEGENPLYLPQAKIFKGCCALGPFFVVPSDQTDPRDWSVQIEIVEAGKVTFEDSVSLSSMKRSLDELVDYLFLDNEIFPGTVLLTGTGIVPRDEFTLRDGQIVRITIGPLGTLVNPVVQL